MRLIRWMSLLAIVGACATGLLALNLPVAHAGGPRAAAGHGPDLRAGFFRYEWRRSVHRARRAAVGGREFQVGQ